MQIASQLEPDFNAALAQALGLPVLAVPRGVPQHLPATVALLVAAPMDADQPPPAGWPFGLEWVQLVTSGTDKHPRWLSQSLPTATARGVAANQIAEYALAAMLYQAKSLADLWVQSPADWQARALGSLAGSTVGVVGLGAIGSALARRLLALDVRVIALRARPLPSPVPGVDIQTDLGALLAACDHVVLAAPATAATRHLLNRDTLARAKPGLHIVNVARGELIDDQALLWALEQGLVAAATLDATDPEPLPPGHPYYTHPRVRLSPHTAAIGRISRLALAHKTAQNHRRWLAGQGLLDRVGAHPDTPAS
ncbi:NAD(P)-dependent oxidoreductase [Bordetella genomosp. 12]|uniref:D-isomer specific 2-hydroxyacid dehydrogenase NAD-binding domain-containing protein n=1 Tax=Bordetella genomosp. 12 TaxID=463035 RepID=A0A261VCE7_9BORD|nr:NAD(P)-dependent oxidoreductase [Bordetella genomosp. 12]OZI71779.1 hypothetical protein CAL22_18465 [Bordetella genomosp. 12]